MDVDGLKAIASAVCVLAGTAIGYYAGYMTRDSMEVIEDVSPAPEKRLPGGGLKLERALQSAPEAQELPAAPVQPGTVVERRARVVAAPRANKSAGGDGEPTGPAGGVEDCPPVTVDLALIREGEGRRVLAWSPDGRILGGLDVPIIEGIVPASQPWAAGVSYDPFDGTPGAWVERDYGRIRVGVDVYQERNALASGLAVRVRAGWRW
ncbi:MAG: hypothetical protein ACPHN2_08570 [Sinimarinibacterium flocculans]|uniref:hypothetical protein n=1 Tax=Sinimarinibacterium flocculans TaxID=985250 RepID=UPI003C66E626